MKNNTLKRILTRAVFPVGSVRTILFGPCRGMQVQLSRASGHAILVGYDSVAQRFLTTRVARGATVFDVGANCGHYTLLLARLVGPLGRVVACEPAAAIFEQLMVNVGLNDLKWVQCESVAVARSAGTLRFFSSPDAPTMGKIESAELAIDVPSYSSEFVRATTIDDLTARWGPPAVVKVDTEGAAGEVLGGASMTARQFRPAFLIEVHGPSERAAVQSWAEAFEYSIADLNGRVVDNFARNHVSPVWVASA